MAVRRNERSFEFRLQSLETRVAELSANAGFMRTNQQEVNEANSDTSSVSNYSNSQVFKKLLQDRLLGIYTTLNFQFSPDGKELKKDANESLNAIVGGAKDTHKYAGAAAQLILGGRSYRNAKNLLTKGFRIKNVAADEEQMREIANRIAEQLNNLFIDFVAEYTDSQLQHLTTALAIDLFNAVINNNSTESGGYSARRNENQTKQINSAVRNFRFAFYHSLLPEGISGDENEGYVFFVRENNEERYYIGRYRTIESCSRNEPLCVANNNEPTMNSYREMTREELMLYRARGLANKCTQACVEKHPKIKNLSKNNHKKLQNELVNLLQHSEKFNEECLMAEQQGAREQVSELITEAIAPLYKIRRSRSKFLLRKTVACKKKSHRAVVLRMLHETIEAMTISPYPSTTTIADNSTTADSTTAQVLATLGGSSTEVDDRSAVGVGNLTSDHTTRAPLPLPSLRASMQLPSSGLDTTGTNRSGTTKKVAPLPAFNFKPPWR